jgi:hypothetical protein
MAGKHRAPAETIHIVKTSVVPDHEVRREETKIYTKVALKFPRVKPIKRAPHKGLRTTFKAFRPKLL